jgi:probable HAF family extracellular repeat protein
VIAGYVAAYAGNQTSQQAFRWTENTGFTLLDHVPINPQYRSRVSQSISGGISADGTRIVGYSGSAWSQPDPATEWRNVLQEQTVYWNGTALPIVLPNQEARNRNLTAISGNGQTLVGQVDGEAGIWNSTNGYTRLGDFAGGTFDSAATAASADGSVVVGYRTGPTTVQAFRWTAAGGMVGLTNPQDGDNFSLAQDVAADGAMIVGKNHIGAFMWTPETGMQSVQEVLIAAGVPMDGWTLNSAIAVSADGSTIVGTGTHASNPYGDLGWIARIRGTGTGTVNPNNPVDEVPTGSGGSNNPPTGSGNSNGTPEGEGSGGDVMPVGTGGGGAGGGGTGVNQGGNGSIPGTANGNTDAIPTPAMLPALLGFGARLWRKQQVAKAH